MERHTTHIYIYLNFNMGASSLVQGLGIPIVVQSTGSKAVKRFAHKSHHGMRAEIAHSVMYLLVQSFLKIVINPLVQNLLFV